MLCVSYQMPFTPCVAVPAYPSTWQMQAKESETQGHLQQHSKHEASPGSVRPWGGAEGEGSEVSQEVTAAAWSPVAC